jgi:hypothetical protein
VIGLNVGGRYWAQFSYQFAHELTHVLSNYERVSGTPYANQWFIESLCETASMFAVGKMAECWVTNAPYPNWRSFAIHLKSYSGNLVNAPDRQLPAGTNLAQWYALHASELRQNPVNRKYNAVVALQLLSFFQQKPQNWELVGYLNLRKGRSSETFEDFFANWAEAAPERLRPFVWQIASRFDIQRETSGSENPNPKATVHGPI